MIVTYYNKASFISTKHPHSLFRRKQNVQNILLKRVEDISKQYLLILYTIVRYVHTSNLFIIIFVNYPSNIWMQTQCAVRCKISSHFFFIDVLIKIFNCSMGQFLFQSIFYLLVIFKMPYQFSYNFYRSCKL